MRFKSIICISFILIACFIGVSCNTILNENKISLETVKPDVSSFALPTVGANIDTSRPSPKPQSKKVGILLPEYKIWELHGSHMKQQLEELGYSAELQYANGDSDTQVSQLKDMVAAEYDVLVIAMVNDTYALDDAIVFAYEKGIPVISYAQSFNDPKAISYQVRFDYNKIGLMIGQYIDKKLNLKNQSNSFNIEMFGGDYHIGAIYPDGTGDAREFLQSYFESGKLVVPSDQINFLEIATVDWSGENASMRMKNLIKSQKYGPNGKKLDVVLCDNDVIAQGVTQALLDAGFTPDDFPIITGSGCDIESVKNIIGDTQSMSILSDPRVLADHAAKMIDSILKGETPEINSTEALGYLHIDTELPTYLCDPVVVTKENYRKVLIDSGYYTEEEING